MHQEVDWEWKQDLNQLCFAEAECVDIPALPNGEKLTAIDVSKAYIVAGVSDKDNVYLSKAEIMKWKMTDKGKSVSISSS